MSNSSVLYVRIDNELKSEAEGILAQLGITPSGAIQMLYKQIIIHNGLPFDLRLPSQKPVAIGGMSREELDVELTKGVNSAKAQSAMSVAEVEAKLKDEFDI